jgi:hypothetical protein
MPVLVAVPELGMLVIAAAAMLLTWATVFLVANLFAPLFRVVPVFGGNIADAIVGAAHGLQDAMENAVRVQFQGFTDTVDLITGGLQWALQSGLDGITALWGVALDGFKAVGATLGGLQRNLQAAQHVAQGIADDVSRAFDKLAAQAVAIAKMTATIIPRLIQDAVGGVRDWAKGIVNAVARSASDALESVRLAIRAFIMDQVRSLSDTIARIQATLQHAVDDAIRGAQRDLQAAEGVLQGDIDGLTHDLQHLLDMVGPIAAGMTIAELIAEVAREVTRIARCTDPTCSYLGPQLGALNAIEDAALLAAVAVLVSEAVNDPYAAAAAYRNTMGPVVGFAREVYRDTTGRAA